MLHRYPQTQLQRAVGRAEVGFEQVNGQSALQHLHQSGCLKAIMPRTHKPEPEVVLVNTAGGIAGGDHLCVKAQAGAGTTINLTSQTAERIYRSEDNPGTAGVALRVGAGAKLRWMPQETILFDHGQIERHIDVDIEADGAVLLLESYMLGRKAMGEEVLQCWLKDRWTVRRAGRIEFAEAVMICEPSKLKQSASMGDNLAFATLAIICEHAELGLSRLRMICAQYDIEVGTSAWSGVLLARFISPDSFMMRKALSGIISQFENIEMPRVWQM